jgi:hypothetical protein
VNTGGVPLSVFELVTATWASEGFHLRDDWFGKPGESGKPAEPGRHKRLSKRPLLRDVQPTDFLQGFLLLSLSERRARDLTLEQGCWWRNARVGDLFSFKAGVGALVVLRSENESTRSSARSSRVSSRGCERASPDYAVR